MQIEAAHVLAGVGKVAVAQSKHAGKLVDTRLSKLVYEQAPLLCQIQVVKPNWHKRYNIDTDGSHHGDHDGQVLAPVRYDTGDVNGAWHVTWLPSVLLV